MVRDDGCYENKSARLSNKTRNELHKCYKNFGIKITADANLHVVNFLDVTLDLNNGKFKPYRKPNDDPLYINRHSNHPPSITKQLPTSIHKRILILSADEQTFHGRHSNLDHKIETSTTEKSGNRQCNIIWFNPQ
jgi:hypothetical protein